MKPERWEHEGHHIEVREREGRMQLLIDNIPTRYGRLPNGQYFLEAYAFDWSYDLAELARRFIDHRRRAEKIRAQRGAGKGGK